MRKAKRQSIATIRTLMHRPKWWNEAFAKYNQKKLHAWAAEQHAKALQPIKPKLEFSEPTFSDRLLFGELYRPFVAKHNLMLLGGDN